MFQYKKKKARFVQEYLYAEDYSLLYEPKKEKKPVDEGKIIEIDLDNAKIQII